ncbi:MAG: hypothetical protein KME32_26920 [Mojavia pulchra JT2-VF2]|jgi:hypothetical protein|uniref:Uncharacterized protein n=1 Tax=Mojavia pulchra JT2-VF2 TaxID=287848 RepID=A0A951Q2N0_9NOST|nr:hypothetical protein [Mojavia pulchra JT2-VF2]
MNYLTFLIRPCLIATLLTLSISQNTLATTCNSQHECYTYASHSNEYHQESHHGGHPYATGITIMAVTLITTKIAKSALKSWLTKP